MDVLFSDIDSFSDSSSSEDQDYDESMYGGQASCILSSLEESIGKIDNFLLFERGYTHGDIVCFVKDPSGQMGRVIGVDMTVELESIHGRKMKDVNSKNIQKIRCVSMGDYVVAGPWVGKVEKIVDCVTVLFDDGSKCEFTIMGQEELIPLSPEYLDDIQYPYYPGQRVQIKNSSMSKAAGWFCGLRKQNQDKGTVSGVEAGLVFVDWLGCAMFGHEKSPAPPRLQNSKDLTFLSCFPHSNWQLGDGCIYPRTNNMAAKEHTFLMQRHLTTSFQEIFLIAKTKTKVDIIWQDGSRSIGVDSHSLFPINIVDAHDFWPGQFVLEKGTSDDARIEKWGVVKDVDAKEKTVRVRWETSQDQTLVGEQMDEIVSAYELVEHPDYSYSHGDVVFRFQKGQYSNIAGARRIESDDKGEHTRNSHLSLIGIVVGFYNGLVEVKWASGFTSKVAPHEIFRVEKSDGLSATPVLHEEAIEPNEDNSERNNQPLPPKEEDLLNMEIDGNNCLKGLCDSNPFNVPRVAIQFFTTIASSVFRTRTYTLSDASHNVLEDGSISEIHREKEILLIEQPPSVEADIHSSAPTNSEKEIKETQECLDLSLSSANQNSKQVRQFDVGTDCSSHHFVDSVGKGLSSTQVKRAWLKKVQQEWSILERDLPESIYVRVYEERMDLLHAAIVGAPGTPYHDGLFFFDIFLPPDYPHEPPMLHYNSGGLRLNPNLYESGKVCLSLLNTWAGTGTEVWNPKESTILQVLLSLQALVLNDKPYFNEAGYDKQIGSVEGEKNSISYNENAFLVSCKSMLYVLRRPPKHFEEVVEEHFRQRGKYILMACKAYLDGVPIGCAFGEQATELDDHKATSTGFKIMLAKLYPKLVEAFSEKGIDCEF